jgi:hypothetical protein
MKNQEGYYGSGLVGLFDSYIKGIGYGGAGGHVPPCVHGMAV